MRTECDFITALWVAITFTGECVFAFSRKGDCVFAYALGEKARGSLEHVKIDPMPISPGSVLAESGQSLQARRTHESERRSSEFPCLKPYANNQAAKKCFGCGLRSRSKLLVSKTFSRTGTIRLHIRLTPLRGKVQLKAYRRVLATAHLCLRGHRPEDHSPHLTRSPAAASATTKISSAP